METNRFEGHSHVLFLNRYKRLKMNVQLGSKGYTTLKELRKISKAINSSFTSQTCTRFHEVNSFKRYSVQQKEPPAHVLSALNLVCQWRI